MQILQLNLIYKGLKAGKDDINLKDFFQMLREDGKELLKPVKPFGSLDYIAVLLVTITAFLVFGTDSIVQTASSSFGYLNRQFLNFYEYAKECHMEGLFYMPLVYMTYAVWNLPLKLTFLVRYPMPEVSWFVLIWYKLFLVILYIACTYLVYKIAMEIGMGIKKAKLCALATFTMPVGFFLQFSYGQILSMALFFLLLGFYFYLKGNRVGYIVCFAIAVAYQLYAVVLILPLLLLKEKRFRRLCEDSILVLLPYGLEYLLYSRNAVFLKNVKLFDINKDFSAGMNIGIFTIQYVIFFWILILGFAYFTHAKSKKDLAAYACFFIGLSGVATLCLTNWNVEYFIFLVPISVLAAFLHKDIRIFMILDIGWAGLMAVYILFQQLGRSLDMVASLYTILLLVIVGFKHPAFLVEKAEDMPLACTGWIRFRFLVGAAICVLPALTGVLSRM